MGLFSRKPPKVETNIPETGTTVTLQWDQRHYPTQLIKVELPILVCQALPRTAPIKERQRMEMQYLTFAGDLRKMPVVVQEILDTVPMIQLLQTGMSEDAGLRADPRIPVHLPVAVTYLKDRLNFKTHCLDISAGGCRFVSEYPATPGDRIMAQLDIRRNVCEIQGHVVRVTPTAKPHQWSVSVIFDTIRPQDRRDITDFVAQERTKFS